MCGRPRTTWIAAAVLAAVLSIHSTAAPQPGPGWHPDILAPLWQQPADVSTQDLFNGPWGAALAPSPDAVYTFVRKKTHGTNPGLVVTDSMLREWHVKQGREASPEVVVSRVLSALGFHQPPVYFLPPFNVIDGHTVDVVPGGRFRLKINAIKSRGEWSWYDNPFIGTRPYNALLVILVLLNSADLKNVNNVLYDLTTPIAGATHWFVVRDVGTSLGEVGRFDPKPNDVRLFERHGFISGTSDGFVKFDYAGVHGDLMHRSITVDDVRWACRLLARLSDTQWRDAFRAGGYDAAVTERYRLKIREKIAEGLMP